MISEDVLEEEERGDYAQVASGNDKIMMHGIFFPDRQISNVCSPLHFRTPKHSRADVHLVYGGDQG